MDDLCQYTEDGFTCLEPLRITVDKKLVLHSRHKHHFQNEECEVPHPLERLYCHAFVEGKK